MGWPLRYIPVTSFSWDSLSICEKSSAFSNGSSFGCPSGSSESKKPIWPSIFRRFALSSWFIMLSRPMSISRRLLPRPSRAPHFTRLSRALRFMSLPFMRLQKSRNEPKGPPPSRSCTIRAMAGRPRFFTAARPKRRLWPSTAKPAPL